ncbi:hypothetical protein [Bacillus sp. FSL M8-0168]|uniref:hypothetical protein n=1 Tax=Bacillus sp. FSL M8-0168 TaxID=2921614 RepID=UPI0030FDAEF9
MPKILIDLAQIALFMLGYVIMTAYGMPFESRLGVALLFVVGCVLPNYTIHKTKRLKGEK